MNLAVSLDVLCSKFRKFLCGSFVVSRQNVVCLIEITIMDTSLYMSYGVKVHTSVNTFKTSVIQYN